MAHTTNFFLTAPNHSLTVAMTGDLDPKNDNSTDLFETEENHTMTQQSGADTELDYNMTPAITLDFGSESYLTPRKSVRDCALSLDPPSLPPRMNQYDRHDCKRISREGLKTLHQTMSIIIPSIGSKNDNQTTSTISLQKSSFKLRPRSERVCNLYSRLQL